SGMLSVRARGRTAVGRRLAYRQTDVTFAAEGARLAGTVTEALGAGPHPAIVVVHGSEPGQRYFYDFWVGLYASIGLTVLTYDKRGQGASTGVYPGESPTDQTLQVLADDASAALRFLAAWPGADAPRVGLPGVSQGGGRAGGVEGAADHDAPPARRVRSAGLRPGHHHRPDGPLEGLQRWGRLPAHGVDSADGSRGPR